MKNIKLKIKIGSALVSLGMVLSFSPVFAQNFSQSEKIGDIGAVTANAYDTIFKFINFLVYPSKIFGQTAPTYYSIWLNKTGQGKGRVVAKEAGGATVLKCDFNRVVNGLSIPDCYSTGGAVVSGTSVTFYAEPDPANSVFGGWNGCQPDASNPFICTETAIGDFSVQAKFTSIYYLTVNQKGDGAGTVASQSAISGNYTNTFNGINCGSICVYEFPEPSSGYSLSILLNAVPVSGSEFVSWDGCDNPSGSSCTENISGQRTLSAIFRLIPRTLAVTKSGTGTGVVISSSPGIYCGTGGCSGIFGQGTKVSLNAYQGAGSVFVGWTGCDTSFGASCSVNMGSINRTINAQFNTQ